MSHDPQTSLPEYVTQGINLASAELGAKAIFASDEFFAPLSRMLNDSPAVFIPDKYDDNGKWMDGWESRRRRGPGHDYAVVKLAAIGKIFGFDVDTSHFIGNFPPACKIEACLSSKETPDADQVWSLLVPMTPLRAGVEATAHHYIPCSSSQNWSHIKLSIFPDGGVARLRVYGQTELKDKDNSGIDCIKGMLNLSSALNGARIIGFSDAHFGAYKRLLSPGRGVDMGDGWETARRRKPGNEWIVIALAERGIIEKIHLDTAFFKGNFPESFSLQGADMSEFGQGLDQAILTSSLFWPTLFEPQKLKADAIHIYDNIPLAKNPITHIKLNIYPDGGVSRLKLYGKIVAK